jgi:hypothetical protein
MSRSRAPGSLSGQSLACPSASILVILMV